MSELKEEKFSIPTGERRSFYSFQFKGRVEKHEITQPTGRKSLNQNNLDRGRHQQLPDHGSQSQSPGEKQAVFTCVDFCPQLSHKLWWSVAPLFSSDLTRIHISRCPKFIPTSFFQIPSSSHRKNLAQARRAELLSSSVSPTLFTVHSHLSVNSVSVCVLHSHH